MMKRIGAALLMIVFVVSLSTDARGQILADHVPGDASLFIAWRGTQDLGANYDGSHLAALLKVSSLPAVFTSYFPQALSMLQKMNSPAAAPLGLLRDIGPLVWQYPSAVYFGGMDAATGAPKLALICRTDQQDAQELTSRLSEAVQGAGLPMPVNVETQGDFVVVTVAGYKFTPLDTPDTSLAKSAAYTAALGQVDAEPQLLVYVDGQALTATASRAMAQMPLNVVYQRMVASLQAQVKHLVLTGGFDGKDWAWRGFVEAPAPRSGLMAALEDAPLSDAIYKAVPASATSVAAWHLKLASLLSYQAAGAALSGNDAWRGFYDSIGMTPQDLQQMVEPFGDEWVYFSDPLSTGDTTIGGAIVNRLADPAAAERSLGQLDAALTKAFDANMNENGGQPGPGLSPKLQFLSITRDGTRVHYLATPVLTPSWAIRDGYLFLGLSPQTVLAAVHQVEQHGPSLNDNATFTGLRTALGAGSAQSFSYYDLPHEAAENYGSTLLMAQLLHASDLFGVYSPPLVLPPFYEVAPELECEASFTWSDDAGIHYRSRGSFPGSSVLVMNGGVGAYAMGTSILLPSLNRARTTANRVKSASNLRQIGMGALMYSNDNQGKYPPDLGTLVTSEQLSASVFASPAHQSVPGNVLSASAQEQASWVNANSDYVYLGAGKTTAADPGTVIAYEKPEVNGNQGGNVLYADGHVEWQTLAGLRQAVPSLEHPAQP